MATTEITTAKVARVVSERQLALNKGKDAGIESGDIVFLDRVVEIKDPDTGEKLGGARLPKLRLQVGLVAERFCLASVTDRVEPEPGSLATAALFQPYKRITEAMPSASQKRGEVGVKVGEPARVVRTVVENDEPPF